jgi:hypothetical protein
LSLERFRQEHVAHVVVIGDVCEMGERMEETCRLLADAKVVGVWGYHDFGLCVQPTAEVRARYSPVVLDFMASLRPRLEIDGCFSHIEPWLDPERFEDMWYFEYDGIANAPQKLERIFNAVPNRLIFAGHYHQWLVASESGIDDWHGEEAMTFSEEQRHFVVINALCDGCSALLDTQSGELMPLRGD